MLLTTTYDSVGSRWIIAPTMVATLTAAGLFFAWLKDRAHSVWPVAFGHGTVNAFISGGGPIVITSPVALAYTAGEGGIVTFLAAAGAAVFLLMHGRTRETRVSLTADSDSTRSARVTAERV